MVQPEGKSMTQDMNQAQTMKPVAVARDEGEARWWFGTLSVIRGTAADTGGQMTIVEITNPPGFAGPLHVHHREDEAFWILDGDVTFEVGDFTIEARVGDYVFGPRGIPHRYTVGDAGARMLFIFTPGGFEEFIRATSEPAVSRTVPTPSAEAPDLERIAAIARTYGSELLV
jgi:quercetin dioxygenase-like cupin family protein